MAKQCGPLFFEGTWGDITFYKMEDEYYARWKSSLTRERVLTDPAFIKTRLSANLLAAASPIASSIYSQLPIGWRQHWMYREFTGEAKIMLQHEHTPEEVYDYLWKTYVEYWVIYQQVTGIPLKTGRTAKKKKPRPYKTILRHRGSDDKYSRRYYNQLGKRHRRSSYDHTQDLLAIDEKRERKALNDAAWQKTLDKEKSMKEEEVLIQSAITEVQQIVNTPSNNTAVQQPVRPLYYAPEYQSLLKRPDRELRPYHLHCHPEPACPPELQRRWVEGCAEDRIIPPVKMTSF